VFPELAQWHGFCSVTGEELSSHPSSIAGVTVMSLRHSILVAALALSTLPAWAQTAAPAAPASPWTITGNAGLFSDYRFRGISQTALKPAFQGGFDVAHVSGFYAGNWNSNVDTNMYNGASLEMDFYGGYKATFGDFGLDVGAIYYYYPGSGYTASVSDTSVTLPKIDNTEIYIGGSWGPLTAKYSYAVSDFFSAPNSNGSSYLDLGFSYDVGNGLGVVAHYGYQWLKGDARAPVIGGSFPGPDNYSDYKIGATYTIEGFVLGGAFVGTNRDYTAGTALLKGDKNISGNTFVVSLSKTF
jgi:uncharacterized protein (TIGR02001 family)